MPRNLRTLGDGQVWDARGIRVASPEKTFEDLFSGRGLAELARESDQLYPPGKKIFCRFKEKGKITGLSVTRALLSTNAEAKRRARLVIAGLAKNGALGIAALNKGRAVKKSWSAKEKNYWKNLDLVVIGGGVSEDATGRLLVAFIKRYLAQGGLSQIKVSQAKFPGKEAGFLGAVINIIAVICNEAKRRRLEAIGGIGLDLGRDEIGVGLLAINPASGEILKKGSDYWVFRCLAKTPYKKHLQKFLDARQDYTQSERQLGRQIRSAILEKMANLIMKAQARAAKVNLSCAKNIAVAVPGSASSDGSILNSTDYLPFFRKQDGFNLGKSLQGLLKKRGLRSHHIRVINDGIAAGIANAYFSNLKRGKFAFLGVGSGLGGCLGEVGAR